MHLWFYLILVSLRLPTRSREHRILTYEPLFAFLKSYLRFKGAGELSLNATVMSPAVHVLCASVTEVELVPLIYQNWTNSERSYDTSNWQELANNIPADWINKTDFDDIFGFGSTRRPPVFPILPTPYNTVLNGSGNYPDALYLLAAAPDKDAWNDTRYVMCSMSVTLESGCSTIFHATSIGGDMRTDCDENNGMAYRSSPNSKRKNDWVSVAGQ